MSASSSTAVTRVGRYTLIREIASGGMATVHLGQVIGATERTRPVAIKRLHGRFAKDPDFVTMFLEEAHLTARVRHPNIVSVVDVVQSGDELFLVMEYVHGESLATLVRRGGRVPMATAVDIMLGVLRGLHAAHEALDEQGRPLGIVHRDVSPQNILVGVDGIARVADFGVAKAAWRTESTPTGELKGKLSYMAPEQLEGASIDRRVDLYAASIVFWELLTGERLFRTREPGDTILRILASVVERPSTYNPSVCDALDAFVRRGLSRNRARRATTALEMANELETLTAVASPLEVGAWVSFVARDQLEPRAAVLARAERGFCEKSGAKTTGVTEDEVTRPTERLRARPAPRLH